MIKYGQTSNTEYNWYS